MCHQNQKTNTSFYGFFIFNCGLLFLSFSSISLSASQQPQKCNMAYQAAKAKCEAATQAGNARAAQGLPTSSGQNIAVNSGQHANMDAAQCAGNGLAGQGCAMAYSQCMQGCSDYDPGKCTEFQTKGGQGMAQASQSCANQGQSKEAENASMPPIQPPKGGGEDEGQDSTSSTPKAANVAGELSCDQQTDGVSNPDCNQTYLDKCWSATNDAKCKGFVSSYCSGNSGSSTLSASSNAAQGTGSSFCTYSLSVSHCQQPENRDSPSCLWISSRPLACEQNPQSSSCNPKFSNEELSSACQDRGSDPVCIAHAKGTLQLHSTEDATTTASAEENTDTKETKEVSKENTLNANTSTGSVGFISVASTSQPVERSLWHTANQLIHESCEKGELESCGIHEDMPDYVNEKSKGFN